jgi:hypothetical protein
MGFRPEDRSLHRADLADGQRKRKSGEDIALDIDARRHFGQLEAPLAQPEDAPFRDVEHLALLRGRDPPAERDFVDGRNELPMPALLDSGQPPILDRDGESAGGEGPDEDDLLALLADVDESSASDQAPRETADVDISQSVALGHAEHRHVEAPAVDEVEHGGMVDDGLGIHGRSEGEATHGDSADDAGIDGERHEIGDALLVRHDAHIVRHPDARVHDTAGADLDGRPAGDDLALVKRQRRDRFEWYPYLTREGRVIARPVRLHVVLRLGHDNAIDEDTRDAHLSRGEGAGLSDALDLAGDESAGIPRRYRQ